jgi:hypothetical protein
MKMQMNKETQARANQVLVQVLACADVILDAGMPNDLWEGVEDVKENLETMADAAGTPAEEQARMILLTFAVLLQGKQVHVYPEGV